MAEPRVYTARDLLTKSVFTLRPDTKINHAARTLIRKGHGGAPVVDDEGRLVGVLSELDCLTCFLSDSFSWDARYITATVADFMKTDTVTVEPHVDVYGMAQLFIEHRIRRLVVVQGDRVVGLVTRRDLGRGIIKMEQEHQRSYRQSSYPDYPPDRVPLESRHPAHWSKDRPSHHRLRRYRGR